MQRHQRWKSDSLFKDMRQRLIRGFLDVSIASLLVDKKIMTGYEIIVDLHRKYGTLYSPGTIYPILHQMQKKGLIDLSNSGRGKPYSFLYKARGLEMAPLIEKHLKI